MEKSIVLITVIFLAIAVIPFVIMSCKKGDEQVEEKDD